MRTCAGPSTSAPTELQCPDPFRRPAQQTKQWSVPHACCPRAMHPCIQPPRASRPRAAPCDPSTLVSTCSAARCSRPVCARRRVFCVTSWGARDGLGRFRDVRLTLVLCCATQDLKGLLAGGRRFRRCFFLFRCSTRSRAGPVGTGSGRGTKGRWRTRRHPKNPTREG